MIIDGYGKRHIYAVTTSMTVPSADILNGLGSIYLHDESGASISQKDGHVTYAILSHGEDDRGAYDIQGREIAPCAIGTLAGNNCDGDATFISSSQKIFRGEASDFTHSFAFKASSFEYDWVANDWNACDGECFSGGQTRTVTCQDKQGNTVPSAEESDIDKCGHTSRPILSRACSLGACSWRAQSYSGCIPSTGGSDACPNSTRVVQCLDHERRVSPDSSCNPHIATIGAKPGTQQGCPSVCGLPPTPPTCEELGNCPVVVETCEDRGDCPVVVETCEDRGDCPIGTCTETSTHDGVVTTTQKPEGTCQNNPPTCTAGTTQEDEVQNEACQPPRTWSCRTVYDNPDRMIGPREVCGWTNTMSNWVATTGTQVVTRRRDVITSNNCSVSYGGWAEVSRTGSCNHEGDRGNDGEGTSAW
jgi:hypothetical protein